MTLVLGESRKSEIAANPWAKRLYPAETKGISLPTFVSILALLLSRSHLMSVPEKRM
jgi:hypothetical protein